ncbi:hypothetical protein [Sulfobacillus thermosulfidooxidans]|uniref:hypothetical protein n=1 Tax=Sulfobacillus thermosulfidooxidans TaxID=28034 RepID=UPI0006B52D7F|nr:hypothetical protein [Sulfobacillus thermosulfidooxidans]
MAIRKNILSLTDMSSNDIIQIASRAVELKKERTISGKLLNGTIIGTCFLETSTRTRTAFTVAALRFGADVVAYGPRDLQGIM